MMCVRGGPGDYLEPSIDIATPGYQFLHKLQLALKGCFVQRRLTILICSIHQGSMITKRLRTAFLHLVPQDQQEVRLEQVLPDIWKLQSLSGQRCGRAGV